MSGSKLREALDNCLINFDSRVLVTDLLEEYALPYQEVHQTLEQYISKQEKKGTKYEKRFLLQGVEKNGDNEVYTVVQGEAKLQEWLQKLKNSESSLYSVEVSGGGKAAAQIFKPMSRCAIEIKGLEIRNLSKKANGNVNGSAAASSSAPVKQVEAKKSNAVNAVFGKKTPETSTSSSTSATAKGKKTAPEVKKPSPETKKSPPEVKKEEKKPSKPAANKKGIGNFFAPVGANASKAKDKDTKAAAMKPPTPKKMQDFFKKQPEKTPIKVEVKKQANTSVQLFADDDEDQDKDAAEEVSSDEEEKLEALKRDIITSDKEDDDEAPSTSRKRRRIVDSDEDEDEAPQQKQEKKESEDIMVVDDDEAEAKSKPKSETYLDEDGFVITVKPKKSNVVVKSKAKISPPAAKKLPPAKKSPQKSAPKTKQGNIMSFFTKK